MTKRRKPKPRRRRPKPSREPATAEAPSPDLAETPADPTPAPAPAEAPPERRPATLGESIDLSLRMVDLLPVQTVRALMRKAKRGRLTAADIKTLEECKGQLRRKRDELLGDEATGEGRLVRGSKALAAHYEMSERTIFRWQNDGMPCQPSPNAGEPTLYDLDQVDAWLADRQGEAPDAVPELDDGLDEDGAPISPKARLAHYSAEYRRIKMRLAELELSVRVGELVPAEDVERRNVEKIIAVKRAFLGVPAKVAQQCVAVLRVDTSRARDVAAIIKREVEDAIRLHLAPQGVTPKLDDAVEPRSQDLPGQQLLFEEAIT